VEVTVRVKAVEAVAPLESVTRIVKLKTPGEVGVPLMAPLAKLRPGGSDPEMSDHVYGRLPPAAAIVCEYATPTAPCGRGEVVLMLRNPDEVVKVKPL
jgi:hypothetical protein